MAFRTNYRFERRERDRLKQAKKEEKLRKQQERKAAHDREQPQACLGAGCVCLVQRDLRSFVWCWLFVLSAGAFRGSAWVKSG